MARDIYWTPASDMDDFLPARYLRHLNNLKWEYLAGGKTDDGTHTTKYGMAVLKCSKTPAVFRLPACHFPIHGKT